MQGDTTLNVVDLPKSQSDLEKAIEQFKRNMTLLIEYTVMNAKVKRAEYDALIANGFTPQQALELLKK